MSEAKKPADEMRFVVSKFSPVYISTWEGEQSFCSICKQEFLQPCATCEAQGNTEPCPIQEGFCGHKFHMHCISKWVKTNPICPMCSQDWNIKDNS